MATKRWRAAEPRCLNPCDLLGQPKRAFADTDVAWYTVNGQLPVLRACRRKQSLNGTFFVRAAGSGTLIG
jgi:hypothetical protein